MWLCRCCNIGVFILLLSRAGTCTGSERDGFKTTEKYQILKPTETKQNDMDRQPGAIKDTKDKVTFPNSIPHIPNVHQNGNLQEGSSAKMEDLEKGKASYCQPPEVNRPTRTTRAPRVHLGEGMEECRPNNQSIFGAASLAISFIHSFRNEFTQKYFGVSWNETDTWVSDPEKDYECLQICDLKHNCMAVIPQLPKFWSLPTTQDGLQKMLVQSFGYAQRYSTALKTLSIDQSLSEGDFLSEMDETQRNMDGVIEQLMSSINGCNIQPDEGLIEEIIEKQHQSVNKDMAALRGFRTLRQCLKGLQYFKEMFPIKHKLKLN